jgi:hypothetical protein
LAHKPKNEGFGLSGSLAVPESHARRRIKERIANSRHIGIYVPSYLAKLEMKQCDTNTFD